MDVGLLVLRLATGVALVGQAKGKMGRKRHRATAAFFREVGFEPAPVLAGLTAAVELAAGILLLAGLATPLAVAAAVGVLVNAAIVNAANGWASSGGGAEYPTTLGLVVAGIGFTGPGRFAVDAALGWHEPTLVASTVVVVTAVATAAPFVVLRHRRLVGAAVLREAVG